MLAWALQRLPAGAILPCQAIAVTIVRPEPALLLAPKPKPFVESMCGRIADQRINENRGYFRLGKIATQPQLHDFGAIAATEIGFFANPDIDRAQVRRDIAPIARLLLRGVDNLEETDRTAILLGNQYLAPTGTAGKLSFPIEHIVTAAGCDHMGLAVPIAQKVEIVRDCSTKFHGNTHA